MLQTSVEMVNPGGTGSPALVISASPEPLPPSRSFMCRLPSAFPLPKKYTCFLPRFAAAFFAINDSAGFSRTLPALPQKDRQIPGSVASNGPGGQVSPLGEIDPPP